MQETFKVQINFPGRDATEKNADIVTVYGPSDGVDECCNQLINDANEMVSILNSKYQFFIKQCTSIVMSYQSQIHLITIIRLINIIRSKITNSFRNVLVFNV